MAGVEPATLFDEERERNHFAPPQEKIIIYENSLAKRQ